MKTSAQPSGVSPRESRFDWPLCYEAETLIWDRLNAFLARNTFAQTLASRMTDETGTLLLDWTDHVVLDPSAESALRHAGFADDSTAQISKPRKVLSHPEAMLPVVVIDPNLPAAKEPAVVALRVENVSDFMAVHGLQGKLEGPPLSRFRRLAFQDQATCRLEVIERRGYRGFVPAKASQAHTDAFLQAAELWKTRPRHEDDDAKAYANNLAVLDRVIELTGQDLACHIVFAEERAYWQRRNRAGRVQKERQDTLGLGWANHDHHTYRSSRRHFLDLMRFMEKLGFERRERYYAGDQAGWGAQILEQPVEGIVTFCDVDLRPEETQIDFSREPLPPSKTLGTIGLWVGLHGESFLQAGMHHLECRFDYAMLRNQLQAQGIETMKPFSDFPFLKQAFTVGERWAVQEQRVRRLVEAGLLDAAQGRAFVNEGAIGSHLENLQRKGGFKGFNQKSVSVIIQATDPRSQAAH